MTSVTSKYYELKKFYPNQNFIIESLRSEGYDVSIRTLRYWRSVQLLPPLLKLDKQVCYDENILDNIRELCNKSGRYLGERICTKILEGDVFYVFGISISKPDKKYLVAYKTNKGLIIERKSDLNGLYR